MNPKPYGVNELREMFLSYFETKEHLTQFVYAVRLGIHIGSTSKNKYLFVELKVES